MDLLLRRWVEKPVKVYIYQVDPFIEIVSGRIY